MPRNNTLAATDASGEKLPVQLGFRQKRLLVEPVAFEEQTLSVPIRLLMLAASGLIVLFIIWTAVTPIDEVASAPGQVIPSGEVKTIQHLEGGVIGAVLVKDGEMVTAGQPLVRMDAAQAKSELDQMTTRSAELRLRAERLQSVYEDREPNFGALEQEWPGLAADQRRIAANQRESYRSALTVIDSQIEQRREEIAQIQGALAVAKQQLEITKSQVAIRKEGVASGVISREVYLETQRAQIASAGEVMRLTDQIRVASNALAEQERRRSNLTTTQRHDVLTEKAAVQDELEQGMKTIVRLRDRVTRLDVLSPVDGFVQDIKFHASGQVVTPGGILMRIVPVKDDLQVEARVASADVGRVHAQQPVRLKVSSYDYTRYGALPGTLERVSPATYLDEGGKPYYKAVIALGRSYVGNTPGQNPVLPGMIVQADIATGHKTLAQYLLKPVVTSLKESFHEH